MKRRTKAQKFEDYADACKAIRENKPVKRMHAKDGSIPTHPTINVSDLSEKTILKDCIKWLKKHGIFCNRHDVGGGYLGESAAYATYGIRGAGDIIGLLANGRHFELEIKRGKGGRLSLSQQKRMKNIRENNGLYFIIHGLSELEHFMGEYLL